MMAHAALVNAHNVVLDVQVISNTDLDHGGQWPESESSLQAFQASLGLDRPDCVWLQCSYSGSFRGAFPAAGWTYDPQSDVFVAPTIDVP